MTPMESLLNAIDNAHPILLPNPQQQRKRPSSPQMSIESILDNRPIKRHCPPPISPPPQSPLELVSSLTTTELTCYHASVAQKSYGSEKRFLCPPPIVQMKNNQQKNAMISMSVVCENNSNSPVLEQRTTLDDQDKGSFKYLFVTGTAKAKQFSLRINHQHQSFFTNPISIISKPSKKTSKARNVSTCLFSHSLVSLFNRINSQTVRTKYLTSDNNQLCAKHASWSPFEIIVISQPQPQHTQVVVSSTPITYGTEIILKDTRTGVCSPSLIIKKVDRGQIIHNSCSVVSQMHKIALQLASSTNENPLYLNANGVAMDTQDSNNNNNTNAWIDYTYSTKKVIPTDQQQELIDDCHCWTIVGITKSEYQFQDHHPQHPTSLIERQLSPPPSPPQPRSIIPYPIHIEYLSHIHALKLNMTTQQQEDIWLGQSIGPLKVQSNGLVYLPDIQDILLSNHDLFLTKPNGTRYFELPLLLSKQDGYMHPIGKSLSYHIHTHSQEAGQWTIV